MIPSDEPHAEAGRVLGVLDFIAQLDRMLSMHSEGNRVAEIRGELLDSYAEVLGRCASLSTERDELRDTLTIVEEIAESHQRRCGEWGEDTGDDMPNILKEIAIVLPTSKLTPNPYRLASPDKDG